MAEYYGDDWPEVGTGLAHYGVKGMKWGVRKEESSSSNSSSDNGGGGDDTEEISPEDLKKIQALQDGDTVDVTNDILSQMKSREASEITAEIYQHMAKLKVQEMSDKALDFGSKLADSLFGKSASRQMADRQRTVNMNKTKRQIQAGDNDLKAIGRKRGIVQKSTSFHTKEELNGKTKSYRLMPVAQQNALAMSRKQKRRES